MAARVFVQYLKRNRQEKSVANSLRFLLRAMQALKMTNILIESYIAQLEVELTMTGLMDLMPFNASTSGRGQTFTTSSMSGSRPSAQDNASARDDQVPSADFASGASQRMVALRSTVSGDSSRTSLVAEAPQMSGMEQTVVSTYTSKHAGHTLQSFTNHVDQDWTIATSHELFPGGMGDSMDAFMNALEDPQSLEGMSIPIDLTSTGHFIP